jgi:hypothetical protein
MTGVPAGVTEAGGGEEAGVPIAGAVAVPVIGVPVTTWVAIPVGTWVTSSPSEKKRKRVVTVTNTNPKILVPITAPTATIVIHTFDKPKIVIFISFRCSYIYYIQRKRLFTTPSCGVL